MNLRFEPIAKPGEVLFLWPNKGFYRVIVIEPIPGYTYNFGTIPAGSQVTKTKKDLEPILMPDNQLAQYRVVIENDNLELQIWQPPATAKFRTRTSIVTIKRYYITDYEKFWYNVYGALTEFYQFQDEDITIVAKNTGTADITDAKATFLGYRFLLEKLEERPAVYKTVPITSIDYQAQQ